MELNTGCCGRAHTARSPSGTLPITPRLGKGLSPLERGGCKGEAHLSAHPSFSIHGRAFSNILEPPCGWLLMAVSVNVAKREWGGRDRTPAPVPLGTLLGDQAAVLSTPFPQTPNTCRRPHHLYPQIPSLSPGRPRLDTLGRGEWAGRGSVGGPGPEAGPPGKPKGAKSPEALVPRRSTSHPALPLGALFPRSEEHWAASLWAACLPACLPATHLRGCWGIKRWAR